MSSRPLVVVADDDDLLQEVVEHKLVAAGYDVDMVSDGRALLKLLDFLRPSLIVLDGMMPVMDGFETLRRLKADPAHRDIPVVMLTALRRETDIVAALNLGAADYLPKPFSPNELIARLGRFGPAARQAV
jgi:DNA-binding response OmpR family regulator